MLLFPSYQYERIFKRLYSNHLSCSAHFYRPLTKLWEGYVFTGVCDSVQGGRACMVARRGDMCGCWGGIRGCYGGKHGCSGGCAWLLWGACVVAPGGACVFPAEGGAKNLDIWVKPKK